LKDPSPSWRFKTELLERGTEELAGRGPKLHDNPNTEIGLAASKAVQLKEGDAALALMRRLQNYVIYAPATPVLRGLAVETQPRRPLGLSGGRLPEALQELLIGSRENEAERKVCDEALDLIGWAESYDSGPAANMAIPLSRLGSPRPMEISFRDKYMQPGRNVLSANDASEGALFVLFLAVLAIHPNAPSFCAVDQCCPNWRANFWPKWRMSLPVRG